MDWSNLLSGSVGGLLVWILTILYSTYKERLNKPKLEIEFYKLNGKEIYIHERDLFLREIAAVELEQHLQGGKCKVRELSLIVRNTGKVHAKNCIAKLTIFKAQNSHMKKEPLQVILGWRRNYWSGKPMESPITIGRNDEEELHFLGVFFFVTPGGKEIKIGTNVEDCPSRLFKKYPELRDIKFGLATTHIIHYNFKPNTKYILKVTVYPENGDPVSKTFELNWNGGITKEDLKKAVISLD